MRPLILLLVAVFAASSAAPPAKNDTSLVTEKASVTVTDAAIIVPEDTYEDVSSRQNSRCRTSQFQCTINRRIQCIPRTYLCNGREDCDDGSDESNALCYRTTTTTESSYYPLGHQDVHTGTKPPAFSCRRGVEFECISGGKCVDQQVICDGYRDCDDGSDEEASLCQNRPGGNETPSRQCRDNQFQCDNGECIASADRCDGTQHCSDNSDEAWNTCNSGSERPPPNRPDEGGDGDGDGESGNEWHNKLRPCVVPPQPENGRWRLHRSLCDSGLECNAPANTRSMDPGSYLVYNCNPGFHLKGNRDVLCGPGGKWVHEPVCEEIQCKDLSSSTTEALCMWNNVAVSCEVPAPVGTIGKLKCREGFVQEVSYTPTSSNVTCQPDGNWSPNPIKCVTKPSKVKLVLEGDMIILK